MLAKTYKKTNLVVISLILLILVFSLSFKKNNLNTFIFDSIESVNAYDLGYSSIKRLLGINSYISLGDTNLQIILGASKKFLLEVIPKIPDIVFLKIFSSEDRSNPENLEININFKNLEKILEDRQNAIKSGILIDPRTVKGKINFRGKEYKADIRLKGDLPDHWRSSVRMSLRISLKGDNAILGMKRFSIHSPGSRQYPHEQAYQKLSQAAGNIYIPHHLLRIKVNGLNWGIMNVEEHSSKEFLEKQGLKESLIFRFGNDKLWQYQKTTNNPYEYFRLSDPTIYSSVYQSNKYLIDELYRDQYSYVSTLNSSRNIVDKIDKESTLSALILGGLWNNQHALNFANSRFYFNPYTLKLETITTDQGPFTPALTPFSFISNLDGFYTDFLNNVNHEDYQKEFSKIFSQKNNIEETYKELQSYFPIDQRIRTDEINKNFEILKDQNYFFESIETNQTLDINYPSQQQLEELPFYVHFNHFIDGSIEINNLLPLPVKILGIESNGESIFFNNLELVSYKKSLEPLVINTQFTGKRDAAIKLITEINNIQKVSINDLSLQKDVHNPLDDTSNVANDFITIEDDEIVFKKGVHDVTEPLIFTGNVLILPGTIINFSEDAYIIIKGTLKAVGGSDNKIIMRPKNKRWKGLYVLSNFEKSYLRNVIFKSTHELRDGILQLTGGVTFYQSNIIIENVDFVDANGEDALNLVKSNFSISNIKIKDTFSDGLDFDFSSGTMTNSYFNNVGGDSVDVSGGNVLLRNLLIENTWDKGISAGEGSIVTVNNSVLQNNGVGIASKDGSSVLAMENQIKNSKLFDLMTYRKKSFYDFPSLSYKTNESLSVSYANQHGSQLNINGDQKSSIDVDVDALYLSEIMSK